MTDVKRRISKKSTKPVIQETAMTQNKSDSSLIILFKQHEWALIKKFSLRKSRPLHPQYL